MSSGSLVALSLLGIAAVGVTVAVVVATQKKPATPAGTGGNAAITLASGQTQSLTVPVTNPVTTIGIPAGGTWVSLTDPTGASANTILNASDPATISATSGTWTGTWTLGGEQVTGAVAITVQIPPSGA